MPGLQSRAGSGATRAAPGLFRILVLLCLLVAPSLALANDEKPGGTLRAVMHSGLRILDPVLTTAYITRNHAYMIYDTLIALDETMTPQPQMASWEHSADKLTWRFTLRDGLKFHDGAPVRAADVVASIRRWMKRDGMGAMLSGATKSLTAEGERTVVLELSRPYGLVLECLARPSSHPMFVMPERIASTPADEAISEHIGSGPFVFVEDEFRPGLRTVYERNDDYIPRVEPPSWGAGGKIVYLERVEWVVMPDDQTALNALLAGEIDFWETPPVDLLPVISGGEGLIVRDTNRLGNQGVMRFNFLHPPFNDRKARRAALLALSQRPFMEAATGDERYFQLCGAMFGCGGPYESAAGSDHLVNGTGMEEARMLLAASSYDGRPVVLLHAVDLSMVRSHALVAAQFLRDAGFAVKVASMDWQSLASRRAVRAPVEDGGWNIFFTNWIGADVINPVTNNMVAGGGFEGTYYGWPDIPEIEALREAFVSEPDFAKRKELAEEIQLMAYDEAMYAPLGQFHAPSAWSERISGVLPGPAPFFWHMKKRLD